VAVYDPVAGRVVRQITLDIPGPALRHASATPAGRRLLVAGPAGPQAPKPTAIPGVRFGPGASARIDSIGWTLFAADGTGPPRELCRFDISYWTWTAIPPREVHPFITPDGQFLLEPVVDPGTDLAPPADRPPGAVRTYRVRSTEDGHVISTLECPPGERVLTRPVLAAGGNRLILTTALEPPADAGRTGVVWAAITVRAFDLATGRPAWARPIPEPDARPAAAPVRDGTAATGVRFSQPTFDLSADGNVLAIARTDVHSSARVWLVDSANGDVHRELAAPDDWDPISAHVALGPGGQVVLGGTHESVVWSPAGGKPIVRLTGFAWQSVKPAFSADGRRLFTIDNNDNAASGRVVRVWCLDTGRELLWLPVPTHGRTNRIGFLVGPGLDHPLVVECDRLLVQMADGVRAFDGSPRATAGKSSIGR
jgi:hypothetical protein